MFSVANGSNKYATNTTINGLTLHSARQLQANINMSISNGDSSYTVASGAYYFDDGSPLLLYRASNFTLIAADPVVELWFRMTNRWQTGGVVLLECINVVVDGFTVDYDPPSHYQGTVIADANKIGKLESAAYVATDQGFPDPYVYIEAHSTNNDPSCNYVDAPAIWSKSKGFGCNRTMGCPGHGAAVLQPINNATPAGTALFALLSSAKKGDKITIGARKGVTWHIQNSTNVTTRNIAIHSSSMFGLSEFDGGGQHTYEHVYLGRRQHLTDPTTQLCGKPPGRLCFDVLSSNADAFHSSGCRRGPTLRNVTLSNNMDDFFNLHSRLQLVGKRISDYELIILDPRLSVAQGVPDDTPYGAVETMTNAKPGMLLNFFELNTLTFSGFARISSLERLQSEADITAASLNLTKDLSGGPPYNATPPLTGAGSQVIDVGQLCRNFSKEHKLPSCASRVWNVKFSSPVPKGVSQYAVSTLNDWDASGGSVRDSHFFGGVDGVRWKSSSGEIVNNVIAATYFEITPLQYYLEGPANIHDVLVQNNTFTACGGVFGVERVNCSSGIPVWDGAGGKCTGNQGEGIEASGTCSKITIKDNVPASSCCFQDSGEVATCCSSCSGGIRKCKCC